MEPSAGLWAAILVVAAIGIFIEAMFLLNPRDLLRRVSPGKRAMEPNCVWLSFILVFAVVWMLVTVIKVRDSARGTTF